MKKYILTFAVLTGLLSAAYAATPHKKEHDKSRAENVVLEKNGTYMTVSMDLDLTDLDVRHDRALVFTPTIVKGDSLAALPSVGVYSHNRWYYYKRSGDSMITGADETSWKESQAPDAMAYKAVLPYSEWMNGAELMLICGEYGCCRKMTSSSSDLLAMYEEEPPYVPQLIYVSPKAELVKARSISGTAYIGFPVNETIIYPGFQNNLNELGKIRATIDSVRNDADVTIKALSIKGYASPEGTYANNARLANGRTASVKQYVTDLYSFDPDFITTSWEAEDWSGLRNLVEASTLPNRSEIIDVIDSDREPDNKEWKIKSTYKDDYRYILDHFYPSLRHSDYLVEYVIRSYSDPAEIGRIMKTRPQNLSLNEFHLYAQTLEPGSPEFIEVYETAVRMYPEDEIANLNAANTALARGDLANAARYLEKAGDSPEADHAREICDFMSGNISVPPRHLER